MRTPWIALAPALLAVGCGPSLIGEAQDDGGTGTPTGTGTGVADDAAPDDGPLDDARPDEGPLDDGPLDAAEGFDTGNGDDAEPPPPQCWQVRNLFTAPAEYQVTVTDQDSDGADEIWVFQRIDNGPGPGDTIVFSVGEDGAPSSQTEVPGPAFGMVDGDGNGFQDLLTASFGGGGPPSLGFWPSFVSGSFDAMVQPFDLQFDDPFVAFVDVSGDGIMDVMRFVGGESIEMLVGDGIGGFTFTDAVPAPGASFVGAAKIAGAKAQFVTQAVFEFDPGPGGTPPDCAPGAYTLFDGSLGLFDTLAVPAPDGQLFGQLLNSDAPDDTTTLLYVDACDPVTASRGIATLRRVDQGFEPSVLVQGVAWSAVADFDGDGTMDALWAGDEASPTYQRGLDGVAFADGVSTGLDAAAPAASQIFPSDLNGDGVQELVWAVESRPGLLQFQRVALDVCPD